MSFHRPLLPRPICPQCKKVCATRKQVYCSPKCSAERRKKLRPRCAAEGCPNRTKALTGKYCSKRCAWFARKFWESAEKGRQKALHVKRKNRIAMLEQRLAGMTKKSQIYNYAYKLGYRACYAALLRRIAKGDITINRERRVTSWVA